MKIRNIGDKVWVASRKCIEESVMCPECFGKRYLTVILGDDSRVTIDCAGCSIGYDPPVGSIVYNKQVHDVSLAVIEKVEISANEVIYHFNGYYIAKNSIIFDTKEEAQVGAERLAEEYNKEQLERIHQKEKNNRTWSWHVHYYRGKIRHAKKEIEHSQRQLDAAMEHDKGTSHAKRERENDI